MLRLTLQFVPRLPVLQQGEITGHVFKEDLPLETTKTNSVLSLTEVINVWRKMQGSEPCRKYKIH